MTKKVTFNNEELSTAIILAAQLDPDKVVGSDTDFVRSVIYKCRSIVSERIDPADGRKIKFVIPFDIDL